MRIFTTYFAKLNKLDKSLVPVSIARYTPQWYKGKTCKMLAPSPEILSDYKEDNDWDKFTKRYLKELEQLDHSEVYKELEKLGRGRNVVLVCFEKDPRMCHRSLCARWITREFGISGGELQI